MLPIRIPDANPPASGDSSETDAHFANGRRTDRTYSFTEVDAIEAGMLPCRGWPMDTNDEIADSRERFMAKVEALLARSLRKSA